MFPSNFPLLPALQMVLVIGLVAFVIWFTGNPLALFALQFAWNPPPMMADDDVEPESAIGFTSNGRGDCE